MNNTTPKRAYVVSSVSPNAIASLRAHPHFPEALRMSAAGLAALYRGSRLVNMLMDDKARLFFGYFALLLHFSARADEPGSGLTQTRMKELCSEFGICSAGRAEVMLSLMRYAGYLAAAPDPRDRRFSRLIATSKLIDLLKARWRVHFTAMAPMLPEAGAGLAAIDDDAFVGAMVKAMMARFRAGNSGLDVISSRTAPALDLFGHRSGGMMICCSLLATARGDKVTVATSKLARSFGVSRTHVLKLLTDAETKGLLRTTRQGNQRGIEILPPLAEASQSLFAALYALLAESVREALAAVGRRLE